MTPDAQTASSEAPQQQDAPLSGMAVIEQHISRGLSGSGDQVRQSTQGELAAAEGSGSEKPTARKWSDEDRQVAHTVMGRLRAPQGLLDGTATPDQMIEWSQSLHRDQQGIDAKTKRLEDRISELEGRLVESLREGRNPADEGGKPKSNPELDSARDAFAEALGVDAKEISPALEKLIAAIKPKDVPAPKGPSKSDEVAEAVLVKSARSELSGEWPGLKNDALFADILDRMATLQGPYYDKLPAVQRSEARMRDAATLVLGPPQSAAPQTQTRDQRLRAQVPTPQHGSKPQAAEPEGPALAEAILRKHGLM